MLIYCQAVFTLYYKEITQLEWDQAGNTVSRFYNLMAKRKQEPGRRRGGEGGGWRRPGDYSGGLSWQKQDNVQEAQSFFDIGASVLTNNAPGSCVSDAEADELKSNKAQTMNIPKTPAMKRTMQTSLIH